MGPTVGGHVTKRIAYRRVPHKEPIAITRSSPKRFASGFADATGHGAKGRAGGRNSGSSYDHLTARVFPHDSQHQARSDRGKRRYKG